MNIYLTHGKHNEGYLMKTGTVTMLGQTVAMMCRYACTPFTIPCAIRVDVIMHVTLTSVLY